VRSLRFILQIALGVGISTAVGCTAEPAQSDAGDPDASAADVPSTDAADGRIDAVIDDAAIEDARSDGPDVDDLPDAESDAADTESDLGDAAPDAAADVGEPDVIPVDPSGVFVSSQKYDGDLGGLSGADARCQALADEAGLTGRWIAWLGDGVDGPATRFFQSETRGYQRVDGTVIANNWTDLVDGTLAAPIDRDETGTELPADDDMIVWTGVFHTGGNPTPVNCERWSSTEAGIVPTGLADQIDTGWTVFAPHDCAELHRLYCFEQ
jgi:hypothetical protein